MMRSLWYYLKFVLIVIESGLFKWVVSFEIYYQRKSQRTLQCLNIDSIIHDAPKIRGIVQKKGVLPLHLWWNTSQLDFSQKVIEKVYEEHLGVYNNTLYKEGRPTHKQIQNFPMSTPCQIFINPDNKLIYMKTTKTGGTSLYINFQKICRKEQKLRGIPQKDIQLCLRAPKFVPIKSANEAKKIWQDYFVFATVRNPYSRAASSYEYLLKRREKLGLESKPGCGKCSFLQFSLNPFIIALQSQKYDCTDNPVHDYLHVEEEAECLLTENGELAVDFVFDMENFEHNWEELKSEIIKRQSDKNSFFVRELGALDAVHKNSVSEGTDYATQLFQDCGTQCFINLANYYRHDFDVLGYNNCSSPL
eukprot:TRINITY_DN870_c0_g1_i2.p1 TRINITY_DN870_c0_g1~~TRINITY_DN870_c0_g1_i2.p1  ORF type:complete len:362 (+),score=45.45 TRINITY_DN870_c0_g1_i2:2335-3420(+)